MPNYIKFTIIIQSNWFYIFRYSYLVALLVDGSSWASSSLILSSFLWMNSSFLCMVSRCWRMSPCSLWMVSSFLCIVSRCVLLSPCSLWMVSSFSCTTTLTSLSWDCSSLISSHRRVLVLKLVCFYAFKHFMNIIWE